KYFEKYDRHLVLYGSYGPLLNTTEFRYSNRFTTNEQLRIRSRCSEYLSLSANFRKLSFSYSFAMNALNLPDSIFAKFNSYGSSYTLGRFYFRGTYRSVTGISKYDTSSPDTSVTDAFHPYRNHVKNTQLNLLTVFLFKKGYSYTVPYSNTYKIKNSGGSFLAYTQPYYWKAQTEGALINEMDGSPSRSFAGNMPNRIRTTGMRFGLGFVYHLTGKHFFWSQTGAAGMDLQMNAIRSDSETRNSFQIKPAMMADFILGWNFDYFFFSYAFNFKFNFLGDDKLDVRDLYFVNSLKLGFRIPVIKKQKEDVKN
ncbi:MAG: hypothetical protein ACK40M_14260, partial [Flavobacteriales bacterium]